jgi:hypothetical protein
VGALHAGVLDAREVAPRTGCVLVFPHGDSAGSLVHEGSAVVAGAKYVLRTVGGGGSERVPVRVGACM